MGVVQSSWLFSGLRLRVPLKVILEGTVKSFFVAFRAQFKEI